MTQQDERDLENRALRERLSMLYEAGTRINESLDLDTVLQGVLDSARALTGARYAVITIHADSSEIEELLTSGLNPEKAQQLWEIPDGLKFFQYLIDFPGPLRIADLATFSRSIGLPEFRTPAPVSSLLTAPIRHNAEGIGSIYVAKDEPGEEFSREDEETLVMFASQAALVIANARKHREEQRVRADLETLINTSPVGVVVFNAGTGDPVSFNREAVRVVQDLGELGQKPEDLLEVVTIRRADGREISLSEFPLAQVLRSAETVVAEEMVMEIPDGRSVRLLINATPIHSDEGVVESVVVTMQDMTPLEGMERLRAEFLGMVSHELRTPLASIRGSATSVLEASSELDPAELRQFLHIIVDQAENMRVLIGDLLDVARIETGSLPIGAEPTEVAVLVDRARNTFLSSGGRDNLRISFATNLPLVMVDRRRIVQVISNLLANAARHSPETSTIRVGAEWNDIHVAISVADEGRGIPAERLPHLFRKFSRGESDDLGGDTGLGLAICKGIVEAHGGRIWAESDGPGMGARFTFTIPTVEEAVIEPERPWTLPQDEVKAFESILVVDDDPQTLRYVRSALSGADYTPIVAASGKEALRLMEERRPELVLLDMMLPESDGIELMGDIFAISDVPVIFISAYGRDQMIAKAFEMGASDYIVKPFSPTELVARVRAALRRRSGPDRREQLEPYVLGDLTIDYSERSVSVAGRPVQLTATEYNLLFELSVNAGRVVTHDHILRRVWGPEKSGDIRTLRTHLRRLRRKIGEDGTNPTYIFAEPRVGYRMERDHSGKPEEV